MPSLTTTVPIPQRQSRSRSRFRSRQTSRKAKLDFDQVTAADPGSDIEVELVAPSEIRPVMSDAGEATVHHLSATKPLKKVSRANSQVSVIEVSDKSPTPTQDNAARRDINATGSWRRRAARSPDSNLVPDTLSSGLARDHDLVSARSMPAAGSTDIRSSSNAYTETQRRASVPVALASYPHASVPSVPFTQLPDLNRIRPIRPALVAEQLMLSEPCMLPRTREFALAPPPYSDADIPPPKPYNEAYPHPLTSYASPGVNASTVKISGYDIDLAELMQSDRASALGTILATCDRPGITAPTLAKHLRTYIPDGNGIPGFDNEGAARAALGPVGAAICRGDERLNELTGGGNGGSGIQPVFTPALSHLPPRLAAQARAETRMREAHHSMSSMSDMSYRPLTPPASPRGTYASPKSGPGEVISDLITGQPSHQLPFDFFQPRAYPAPSPTIDRPASPSSFHKTELCPAYQESGHCKYGKGCQFAHGLSELRLPLSRTAFTFPAPSSFTPQVSSPSAYGFAGPAVSPRTETRRASAPHSNLGTVHETEQDQFPFPIFAPARRPSDIASAVSPVGQIHDRPIRQASIARLSVPRQPHISARDLASSLSNEMPQTPAQTTLSSSFTSALATPSDRLSPGQYMQSAPETLHPRASESSLSSLGGYLPKHSHLDSDDNTPTGLTPLEGANLSPQRHGLAHSPSRGQPTSPIGGDAASTGSRGSGRKTKSNSTSATVDFSTGRSIWC